MTPDIVDPLVCALFLILGFAVAGTAQALWLALPCSRRFSWPLDGGRTFRGRRIFGDNKTVRGFVVMLPCTGAAFVLLSLGADDSVAARLWPLSSLQYGALGVLGAIGCMTGELPNSFIKRQAGIPPGAPATGGRLRILGYVIDRIDSPLGALGEPSPPIIEEALGHDGCMRSRIWRATGVKSSCPVVWTKTSSSD